MGIGKAYPHTGQTLHVRSVELHVIGIPGKVLIGTGIPHAHVISHHEDDIWARGKQMMRPEQQKGY
jgi:hypothetical protein